MSPPLVVIGASLAAPRASLREGSLPASVASVVITALSNNFSAALIIVLHRDKEESGDIAAGRWHDIGRGA